MGDVIHKRQTLVSTAAGVIAVMHFSSNGQGLHSQHGAQGTSVPSATFPG